MRKKLKNIKNKIRSQYVVNKKIPIRKKKLTGINRKKAIINNLKVRKENNKAKIELLRYYNKRIDRKIKKHQKLLRRDKRAERKAKSKKLNNTITKLLMNKSTKTRQQILKKLSR